MKKLLLVGAFIISGISFSGTLEEKHSHVTSGMVKCEVKDCTMMNNGVQKDNMKLKSSTQEIRLRQIMNSTSSDRKN